MRGENKNIGLGFEEKKILDRGNSIYVGVIWEVGSL